MNQMKTAGYFSLSAVLIFFGLVFYPTHAVAEELKTLILSPGMDLPQITLNPPTSEKDRKYLSLDDLKPFSLPQVTAKLIVLEIFSVYCRHCRMQAPKLNAIYKLIQDDREVSPEIKMIGISIASDQNKTHKWKTTMHVPFPLFADLEADIWEKLGKPGVPLTLLVSSSGKILYAHKGVTEDTDEFFSQIKNILNQQ